MFAIMKQKKYPACSFAKHCRECRYNGRMFRGKLHMYIFDILMSLPSFPSTLSMMNSQFALIRSCDFPFFYVFLSSLPSREPKSKSTLVIETSRYTSDPNALTPVMQCLISASLPTLTSTHQHFSPFTLSLTSFPQPPQNSSSSSSYPSNYPYRYPPAHFPHHPSYSSSRPQLSRSWNS